MSQARSVLRPLFARVLLSISAGSRPLDVDALRGAFVRFSALLVAEHPQLTPCTPEQTLQFLLSNCGVKMVKHKGRRYLDYGDLGTSKISAKTLRRTENILMRSKETIAVFMKQGSFNTKTTLPRELIGNVHEAIRATLKSCKPHQIPVIGTDSAVTFSVPILASPAANQSLHVHVTGTLTSYVQVSVPNSATKGAKVTLTVHRPTPGLIRVVVVAQMVHSGDRTPIGHPQIQALTLRIVLPEHIKTAEMLGPKAPYARKTFAAKSRVSQKVVPGTPPSFADVPFRKDRPLAQYKLPGKAKLDTLKDDAFSVHEAHGLHVPAHAYKDYFSTCLYLEEQQMDVDIRHYDLPRIPFICHFARSIHPLPVSLDVPLNWVKNSSMWRLQVVGLAEKRPSVLVGDRVFVHFPNDPQTEFEGFVYRVELEHVLLRFSGAFRQKALSGQHVNVRFSFSRTCLRRSHRGIEFLHHHPSFHGWKVPGSKTYHATVPLPPASHTFSISTFLNAEQQCAVRSILRGENRNVPFVIFGPPGTGKTTTLIEAIFSYVRSNPSAKVVVMAPSNNAADLLLFRLAKHFPPSEMFRVNAYTRLEGSFTEKATVLKYSLQNDEGNFVLPLVEELGKFRIIVTTCFSACLPFAVGIDAERPDRPYFDAIFVDEAGHATESELWSGIACYLGKGMAQTTSFPQLVLAGDPKQLGPIIHSPQATRLGYDVSYLERVLETSTLHNRDPTLGYDPRFVVKLVDNYRSHPAILKFPSDSFYEGELNPCADPHARSIFEGWSKLTNKQFPILFHGVKGKDEREQTSPSWFNVDEVLVVAQYVEEILATRGKGIKASDIGIIAPYRKQVAKLKELLKRNGRDEVQVGTVESFQGQEKTVILISMVRSTEQYLKSDITHRLGFLFHPKRLNVAITRAKALMVIVGNPDVLVLDKHWNLFLKYCQDAGATTGESIQFPTHSETDAKPPVNVAELEKLMEDFVLVEEHGWA